jgi:SNF2 family DNA or RNA helicase
VGGEGLNLVEANHVVFVNRWWNPSANNQAKDRVSRIGQTRTVMVHSFTCRDTVEEVLDDIIKEKGRLSEAIVDALADKGVPESFLQEAAKTFRSSLVP